MKTEESSPRGDLLERTKAFAIRVVKLFRALSKTDAAAQVIGKQVLRSGTSVGAQYREATRARSRAEFISKVESSLQELEETRYWFEILVETEMVTRQKLQALMTEAAEISAMLTASVRTSKRHSPNNTHRD